MKEISVTTRSHEEFVDVTSSIQEFVKDKGDGAVLIYCPHTTAGVVINEGADPDVVRDILNSLGKTFPWKGGYHHLEGNAAAHIKATVVGPSKIIPVQNGRLILGTWQHVFFAEFDGPRSRRLILQFLK